jgi:hypothetical protein
MKKTKAERLDEILNLRRKLQLLGFNHLHEEVNQLFNTLSLFVENGEYCERKFYINGYQKVIYIKLLPRQYAENVLKISHNKDI